MHVITLGTCQVVLRSCCSIYFPHVRLSVASHISCSRQCVVWSSFKCRLSVRCLAVCHCGFICISLIPTYVNHLSTYLQSKYFIHEFSVQVFCPKFYLLACFINKFEGALFFFFLHSDNKPSIIYVSCNSIFF